MTGSRSDPARPSRSVPRLHVVTDDAVLARGGWVDAAIAVLQVGRSDLALHLRGPRSAGAELYTLARRLAPVAQRSGALLFVNDRVDVALASGAAGAQLGARSLPVTDARRILGGGALLGVSVHAAGELAGPRTSGADFALLGTLFPTPSHPGLPGMGLGGLRDAIGAAGALPVLGIGGIGPERAADVMEAGAHGVAVIRGVWDDPSPGAAVARYRSMIGSRDR